MAEKLLTDLAIRKAKPKDKPALSTGWALAKRDAAEILPRVRR